MRSGRESSFLSRGSAGSDLLPVEAAYIAGRVGIKARRPQKVKMIYYGFQCLVWFGVTMTLALIVAVMDGWMDGFAWKGSVWYDRVWFKLSLQLFLDFSEKYIKKA